MAAEKRSAANFALLLSLVSFFIAATVNGQTDYCQATANDVLTSCQNGAQSDYQLALANCDNVSGQAARSNCKQTAAADLKDAQQT
jgi:hypothetical protein